VVYIGTRPNTAGAQLGHSGGILATACIAITWISRFTSPASSEPVSSWVGARYDTVCCCKSRLWYLEKELVVAQIDVVHDASRCARRWTPGYIYLFLTHLFFGTTKSWCSIVTFDMLYSTSYAYSRTQDAGTLSNSTRRTLSRGTRPSTNQAQRWLILVIKCVPVCRTCQDAVLDIFIYN
jgi:hypothetical protein